MLSAAVYNSLPTVTEAHDLAQNLEHVRKALVSIISSFGLGDYFGVRLIHKHFDVFEGENMVFRHTKVEGVCEAVVMGPVLIDTASTFQGKHFLVDRSGPLVPYEYTNNGSTDISQYPEFASAFAKAILDSSTSRVFGLVAKPKQLQEDYTELEIPDIRSTIMVPERMVPHIADSESICTNWVVGVVDPEPVDGCIQTRSGAHHGLWCRKTRNSHTKTRSFEFQGVLGLQLDAVVNQVLEVI
jgi:hypothetical protein